MWLSSTWILRETILTWTPFKDSWGGPVEAYLDILGTSSKFRAKALTAPS